MHRVDRTGRSYWEVAGEVAVPGSLAVVKIAIDREADREWALSVWRGLSYARAA